MLNVLVDDIGFAVNKMRGTFDSSFDITFAQEGVPFYMHGHLVEIANRLMIKDSLLGPSKFAKYPLIALRQDFTEEARDGMWHYRLNILLVAGTKKNLNAEQRYEDGENFKKVLYPLYDRFIYWLARSGKFSWKGNMNFPPHIKIDRPFWGLEVKNGNASYIFNDALDAIEIMDLKISQRIKNCK
jgi:hypothetical protein